MKQVLMPLRRLILQVLLLLAMYFLSRLLFTLINASHFEGLGPPGFLRIAFFALRYDLAAIFAVNALYIILLFLPLPSWRWPAWERATQAVFIFSNSIAFLFELSDWAYFPYNFKRATADVLKMISRQGDFWSLLPRYLVSYWYVPLAAISFIYLFYRSNNIIRKRTPITAIPWPGRQWRIAWGQTLMMATVLAVAVISIRGGLQYIPIGIRNAVQVTDSRYVPVVLNTPFSIITTLMTPSLEEVQYMSDELATRIMPFQHQYAGGPFRKKNVVVIILESGSKEFSALGHGRSFMPFLDSLMGHSLVCSQAFANGQTSAEGIPAIIAGMPTLMDEAFTTSNYGTARITSLPGVLGQEGYASAFFHGGTNGTMSFDIFSDAAGYDSYFGRSEYANEADYDGAWGIQDAPFLQYFASQLGGMQQPFFASVLTLSAHPPYSLPQRYRKSLPTGPLQVQQCIAYTDEALRQFFSAAAVQPWYDSTLFVITADHCSPENSGGFYAQGLGRYAIPLVFYAPGDTALRGFVDQPVQQLDILPSVLHYLGYVKPFFAFGNSILSDKEPRFVITYNSESYQWLERGYSLQTTGIKPVGFFAYPADSSHARNLVDQYPELQDAALLRLKAFVQRYRFALIRNTLQ